MEITIRLGEIWTSDTNANGNSLKERHAEFKPAAVTHFSFVTLVCQVSQACCREQVGSSLTLANPAQILHVVFKKFPESLISPHFSFSQPSQGTASTLTALHLHWLQKAGLGVAGAKPLYFPEDLFNLDMEQNCGAGYTEPMLVFLLASRKRDWVVQIPAQNSEKHKDMGKTLNQIYS